ncbi:MAG TPA: HDIG domain-containing metalloprotein [Pyrinomonadaceae bacterium]
MGLRPRFKTPLSEARDKLLDYALRPLMVFSPPTRFIIGCCSLVILTTLLLINYSIGFSDNYREGEVLNKTIVVPADITTVDVAETERRREAAREATRPVFNFDSSRAETTVQSFRAEWEELKKHEGAGQQSNLWSGAGGKAFASALAAHKFNEADLNQLSTIIREIGTGFIYDDADAERLKQDIVLVDVRNPSAQIVMPAPRTRMMSLSAARRNVELRVLNLPGWSLEHKGALSSVLASLIRPNVVLDQAATAAAREAEASKVPTVSVTLKKNQSLAREGDTVTPTLLSQLAAIRNSGHSGRPWHNAIGLLLLVTAFYWAAWKFTEHRTTASALHLDKYKAFALVGSAILVQTALMKVGFLFGDGLAAQRNAPFNDPMIWYFAIPFAAAALLVAMLVDAQLAFLAGIITAIFAGIFAPSGMPKVLFAGISCSAAVYGIGRYRERQSVTIAGLFVGAVNMVTAVALIAYAEQALTLKVVLMASACGLIGGLLSAIFTAGGLPINESVFGILTDVKLLELSNADLPVLGQLALRAPGTNQHSHAVGQLAEDACRVVGANPLLARIGALYHDIGKLAAPEYFVENQQGENPHDRLRPQQSAKIITSHVTYGAKLAKEIALPKQIADFIPQHHGTRTLHYFLRKAQAQAKPGEIINEDDFRYPGPKPQFKEAAIMMLADSCEAAARSLARPDPENIRAIVIKVFDAIITDGQLDQCDITLQELTIIREAMISALTAIYHARIDYPGFNPPPLTGPLPPLPAANLDSEERGVAYSKPSEVPINRSGEVEDEAIPRRVRR